MKIVVGLGNPGTEYENTRHNTGRILAALVEKKIKDQKSLPAGRQVKFILPDTFMNHSGKAVAPFVKTKKDLENLIVIYDDIDLPLGKIKISFNRSSGGHNGVGSIIKSVKSTEFVRVRVGIAPTTPTGKIRKPKGEEAVMKFLLGEFKKPELEQIKKMSKKITDAIEMIFTEGREKAMSIYN